MKNRNLSHRKFATCLRQEGEDIVQNDLAITPAQMEKMMSNGIAISAQNVSSNFFIEGDTNPSFDLPLDRQRGVDVADMWQAEQSIKAKAKKGLKRDKNLFGSEGRKD